MIITQCLKSYDINAYDEDGWTPLHFTVMCEEPELCRLLCERGDIDVDKGDKESGDTSLHLAAYHGRMEYTRILLDVGKANVNAKNNDSSTSLHCAAIEGHIEAVTLLIERGAEINPLYFCSLIALSYSSRNKLRAILLEQNILNNQW